MFVSDPHICTPLNPWRKSVHGDHGVHPDAMPTTDSDYRQWYHCPNCGLDFAVEIAE